MTTPPGGEVTNPGQTHHCPICEQRARDYDAAQAQAEELREALAAVLPYVDWDESRWTRPLATRGMEAYINAKSLLTQEQLAALTCLTAALESK